MFKFKIIGRCFNDASYQVADPDIDFFLEEDGWNDYWYYTMYHLHSTGRLGGEVEYLGPIRIMRIGQKEYESNLLRNLFPEGVFSQLPDDFVSLSFSEDLYRSLGQLLHNLDEKATFLKSLNIILGRDDDLYDRVKNDECFRTSLLRDTTIKAYPLVVARTIMRSECNVYDLLTQEISIHFKDCDSPIEIRFDYSSGKDRNQLLPSRIVAFIGENGCGKSSILYRIARILYASPDQRKFDSTLKSLEPNDIGFSKLLIVSYSSFDNFVLPGLNRSDFRLIVDNIDKEDGRLYLCGLRDLKAEYKELIEEGDGAIDRYIKGERTGNVILKTPQSLTDEFFEALIRMLSDPKKVWLWNEFNNEVKRFGFEDFPDFAFDDTRVVDIFDQSNRVGEIWKEQFAGMSTGWKFVLHSMANIVARITHHTLLLFDEPENHLHPPLLSFFLTEVRKLLDEFDSGMLISTHSPVALQELYRENVFVIHRHGDIKHVSQPQIQTFGAGFGEINADVFFLNSDNTNSYHIVDAALDAIAISKDDPYRTIQRVERYLGITLSSALKAYVISKSVSD